MSLDPVTQALPYVEESSIPQTAPTIHVAKVKVTNNNYITNKYPPKAPTAEILDSAAKFIETVANTVSTACITFFWSDKNVNVQNILNEIQEGISTRFQNILKSIFSPK